MIRLLLAMLTVRRGAALTAFAIAAVACAAAAAGPLYKAAAESAATTAQISAAAPGERSIRQTTVVHRDTPVASVDDQLMPALPSRRGFQTVPGLLVAGNAYSVARPTGALARLVYRYGVCQHLVALTGRCPTGGNEVMVSARTAADLHLTVGGPMTFSDARLRPTEVSSGGVGVALTVVGTYQPRDVRDPYWAGRFFGTEADPGKGGDLLFGTRETVSLPPFTDTGVDMDFIASRAAFDDPAALRAALQDATAMETPGEFAVASDMTGLLDRVAADHDALADGVRLAAVPLVLLCWFVLHLALANSAFRRRDEFGLAGLRGVPRFTRWGLSTGEVVVPLLLGGAVGYLAGYLLGGALAHRVLPGNPPVRIGLDSVWYALVAVGGALAVGLFAQWRATAAPVATLLRRVPLRHPARRIGAVEAVAVALAVVAGYQIRAGGDRSGLAMLTPMFIALAVGLVAARLAGLVADWAGRWALRRGRLGRALAYLYLARQPGQAQLLGALVILFAVLGFAVAAVDTGAVARTARIRAELGAPRVLSVGSASNRQLLAAERAADPDGRYAMAVARISTKGLTLLAVDPDRLARVAIWDSGHGPSAATVAQALQPTKPMQVRITGGEIEVRATVRAAPPNARLVAQVAPAQGQPLPVDLGELRHGTSVYRAAVPDCATGGCRLLRLEPDTRSATHYTFDITFHELRQYGPDQVVVGPAGFSDTARWASGSNVVRGTTAATADGTRVTYSGGFELAALLRPVGAPTPLPVASTDPLPATISSGGLQIPLSRVDTLHLVPGLGVDGGLVSLEYIELSTLDPGNARDAQIWLSADAPQRVVDKIREAGLVIVADQTTTSETTLLADRGPALALRFYLLVALAAIALGIGGVAVVAAADRWGQTGQLRALRAQGLPAGILWRVGLGGYAALTGAALVLGSLAAALAWWLARAVIPFFADNGGDPYVPAAPRPLVALAALAVATLVLVVADAVAASGLRRAVEGSRAAEGRGS